MSSEKAEANKTTPLPDVVEVPKKKDGEKVSSKEKTSILKKSLMSGAAGASAMAIQVLSLMWMRTTMNYQFKNGGGFVETLKKLYAQGGITRFYRGLVPALIIGPISRFGDTASNLFALTIFEQSDKAKNLPIYVKTSLASACAGLWRILTLPVDAWKTSKQVYGTDGLKVLFQKFKVNGISAFYQGAIASSTATFVGHFPWFTTYNYLDAYLPKVSFKEDKLKALLRGAFMGFICSLVSDTISNSIRVVKTVKQTSEVQIGYSQAIQSVLKTDGVTGLFFRGLQTKLLTNAIQGMIFSVAWRFIQQKMNKPNQQ